jgi:hypothetical protein
MPPIAAKSAAVAKQAALLAFSASGVLGASFPFFASSFKAA